MSPDTLRSMFFSQMTGGRLGDVLTDRVWLNVAYLVCLFAVIVYKPERIRNVGLFRVACSLFAASLLVPILVGLVQGAAYTADLGSQSAGPGNQGVFFQEGSTRRAGAVPSENTFLLQLFFMILNTIGPVLFVISIFCAFSSLVPSFIPPPDIDPMGPGAPRVRSAPVAPQPNVTRERNTGESPIFDSGAP